MPVAGSLDGVTARHRRRLSSERGTASAELVAVIPALLAGVLIAVQLAAVGFSLWGAGLAARAGARSSLIGEDGAAAARDALPGLLRKDADVEDADEVSVEVSIPRVLPVLPRLRVAAHAALEPGDEG